MSGAHEGLGSAPEEETVAVVIIGAGPVGLSLAGLLGVRGVRTVVVEKERDVFALPRAAHIDHTGLRTMQELGCLDQMLASMIPNKGLVLMDDRLDPLAKVPGDQGSLSGLPASMYFYQPAFDRLLDSHVSRLSSVDVRRGCEVVGVSQSDSHAVVTVKDVQTGATSRLSCDFAVACDGARSFIRDFLRVPLESLGFDERWLVLDLAHSASITVPDYAIQVCDPSRPWVANPIPGDRYRVEFKLHDGEQFGTITRLGSPEFIHSHLDPLIGTAAEFSTERRAVYTFHGLVAETWRLGRILLAGDAAHQMPPFLGQGMCSGIRDAANLAWKLPLVLDGYQDLEFLDTYQEERDPHVRSVIASAVQFGQFVSVSDAVAVRERNARLRANGYQDVPAFTVPKLKTGTLVGDGGGAFFPQPPVEGSHSPLDAILGHKTAIIAVDPRAIDRDLEPWTTGLQARVIDVDELGPYTPTIRDWFTGRGAAVAVVRPDHYVMDAADRISGMRPPAWQAPVRSRAAIDSLN